MEPKRLFDGGGSEMERLLICAGRVARPHRTARWRTGVALTLVGLQRSARSTFMFTDRRWGAGRWVLVGVTTTALAWGTAHEAREYRMRRAALASQQADVATAAPHEREHSGRMSDARATSPAPEATALQGATERSDVVDLAKPARMPEAARSPARHPAVAAPSIAREVEELDRVRRLIAAGKAPRAIARLDRYAKAFPSGAMEQEAILLRAEALAASGDSERAKRVAQRALVLYPHSAHAQRFQSIADMH